MAETPEDLIVTDAELRRQLPALADELGIGGALTPEDEAAITAAADRAEAAAASMEGLKDAVDSTVAQSPADSAVAAVVGRSGTLSRRAVETAMADSLMVVAHGEDAMHPRPDTMRRVMWVGSVVPLYREPGDLVMEAAALPVPFSPTSLDLIGWHDATAPGFTTGALTSIPDRSGMGTHLDVAVGTTAPTWEAAGINNLPAFSFQGGALATSKLGQPWTHPVSVYMVTTPRTLSQAANYFFEGVVGRPSSIWVSSGGRVSVATGSTNVQTAGGVAVAGTPMLIRATYGPGTTVSVAVNGGAPVTGESGTSTPTGYRIGAAISGGGLADALIGEVIVARTVTADQDTKTTAYLREKWGTP